MFYVNNSLDYIYVEILIWFSMHTHYKQLSAFLAGFQLPLEGFS